MSKSLPVAGSLQYGRWSKDNAQRLQNLVDARDLIHFANPVLMYQHIVDLYDEQCHILDRRKCATIHQRLLRQKTFPDIEGSSGAGKRKPVDVRV